MGQANTQYRRLSAGEITLALFATFARYQDVRRCWRKIGGAWELKEIAFTEEWDEKDYRCLVTALWGTIDAGGVVLGAFSAGRLIGFASVEACLFGAEGTYAQLSSLHVSHESRGQGVGRRLLALACAQARTLGARKLYLSAHSSEETQAFYRAAGCVEAVEYNPALAEAEPCDCQLELLLTEG